MEQNGSEINKFNGNKITCDTPECFASTAELLRNKKKAKIEDLSTITIGYIKHKITNDKRLLRVLFDSGCSATLINKRFVKHWKKKDLKTIKWSTKAGSFKTKQTCEIEFTLPTFHEHRKISCKAYVDESHHDSCSYDMIIGRDIMHSLGINLLFDTAEITWDNAKVNMQSPEILREDWSETLEHELLYAHDPNTTDAERIQDII